MIKQAYTQHTSSIWETEGAICVEVTVKFLLKYGVSFHMQEIQRRIVIMRDFQSLNTGNGGMTKCA